jgi:hypothetical protein
MRQELYTFSNYVTGGVSFKVKLRVPFGRTFQNYINEMQDSKRIANSIQDWSFSQFRIDMIKSETADWQKHYLPIDLQGKVVLDVGAGEGETAMFFLRHGASKVICIEPCAEAYGYLLINQKSHPFRIIAINKKFDLNHLDIPHDFLKMDIEGYEEVLLGVKLNTPAAVEIHGLQLCDKFEVAGWKVRAMAENCEKGYSCVKYGYWKC